MASYRRFESEQKSSQKIRDNIINRIERTYFKPFSNVTIMKRVIVTIPAYNEEKNLAQVLQEIKLHLIGKYDYRLLVVDDGSTDRTAEIAKQNRAVVISHPHNYGLAEAFKTEIAECVKQKADIIVHTDADGQYPAELIPKLISEIENGASLVLGSRFKESKHADSLEKIEITSHLNSEDIMAAVLLSPV